MQILEGNTLIQIIHSRQSAQMGVKMDMNGLPVAGFPLTELPLGFGMALAMNEPAMTGYAGLSEAEKEKIIMRCRDAKTKSEMQEIVDSLVPDHNVNSLYEGPETR